jgi:uncharacterized repeat protein (TIGR01451 family)
MYTASLAIDSNDPGQPLVQVPLTMTVVASVDLALTQSDTPDPVYTGQPLNYTLNVANNGLSPATGVVLTDTLPAGVTFLSASPSQGSCSHPEGKVACNLGNLAICAAAQVTVSVTAPATGTITNQATVIGVEYDPNWANNLTSQQTEVRLHALYLPVSRKNVNT